ncbi:hypothetical protein KXZ29_27795, partial [Klebsiella pneumoniae]|nr:hypothetical protein [Klebsiella pneumoniae]MBY8355319.1 hypothetical protein [Klebsiella pneumoniae]
QPVNSSRPASSGLINADFIGLSLSVEGNEGMVMSPRGNEGVLLRTYGGLLHPDGLFYRIVHISR